MLRRDFLFCLIGSPLVTAEMVVAATSITPKLRVFSNKNMLTEEVMTDLEQQAVKVFGTLENAKYFGREYLQFSPEPINLKKLLEATGYSKKQNLDIGESMLERREEDFLLSDTAILNGWVLARAEACLCAILALA